MKRLYIAALLVSVLCGHGAYAQTAINRIVATTSDDNLKLELYLSTVKKGKAGIGGEITARTNNAVLWKGELFKGSLPAGDTVVTCRIDGIRAHLWSPADPFLYDLKARSGESTADLCIGFRKFESRGGQFFLNGKPIFLRGNAINPPSRGIPAEVEQSEKFARDYIRFMRGMNVNMIRLYKLNQTWLDVCDQEGMMVFGGCYGAPTGGSKSAPPTDAGKAIEEYKRDLLGPYSSHPAMMVYTLTNEVRVSSTPGELWRTFLDKAYKELITWDHNKQYICNAGYGLGRSADVYDVHRYWGWYYNSFLTYLNLREMEAWQNPGRPQPITFSECVGNYTGVDGRYNIVSNTKQPGSQKCWTGHLPQDQQAVAALEYQAFMMKNATELFRRMRSQNPRLAGIMPFSIIFHNWDGIHNFAEMVPKPAAYQYGLSYQPVLLSWETWQTSVFAGKPFAATVHVVNDDDLGRDLTGAEIRWTLEDVNRMPVASGSEKLPNVPYYGTWSKKISVAVPQDILTGYYALKGIILQNGKSISTNSNEVFVAGENWKKGSVEGRELKVYDPDGNCRASLAKAGIVAPRVSDLASLSPRDVLVIAEMSWGKELDSQVEALKNFASQGGRIVCLRQDTARMNTRWLPVEVDIPYHSMNNPLYGATEYTYSNGMHINLERKEHAVFEGLTRDMFRLWSDYNDYDESKPGFPAIYPVTNGYEMRNADLRKVQILANYNRNLSGVALCEIVLGKGSVILSGFDLTSRCGVDPVAEKLLVNILRYAASDAAPQPYLAVDEAIVWGDYQSENGIVTGPNNGLAVSPYPVTPVGRDIPLRVDELGYLYAGGAGGWNNRPGIQYMPRGRRPFAPYHFGPTGPDIVRAADAKQGSGYFLAKVAPGKQTMSTLLENPSDATIAVTIAVNDLQPQQITLEPRSSVTALSPLPAERDLKVTFTGDRRTVILRTEFK